MATSEVGVCNAALIQLGAKTIASRSEDSKAGRLCNARFDDVRDEVQASYPWNCCKSRATLAQLTTTPDFEYSYEYQLPADPFCLRVVEMYNEHDYDYIYEIEGRKLLTNEGTVSILYIARTEDVAQWSPLLADCVATRLAAEIAYALTASRAKEDAAWDRYYKKLPRARSLDAQEGRAKDQIYAEDWIEARL